MLKRIFAGVASLVMALPLAGNAAEEPGDLIRLVAAFDEPEFYCVDLAGWGEQLKLNDPLQTHTCKSRSGEDQMFHFSGDRLKVSLYDRCVQVAGSGEKTLPGSAVLARECSDDPLQNLSLGDDGRIRIGASDLCLGAGVNSTEASGPSHMWRTLTVVHCDNTDEELVTWQTGL